MEFWLDATYRFNFCESHTKINPVECSAIQCELKPLNLRACFLLVGPSIYYTNHINKMITLPSHDYIAIDNLEGQVSLSMG